MRAPAIRVTQIGDKARRLAAAGAAPAVLASLSRSLYLEVAGEVVWLGPPGSTLHARAMIAERPLDHVPGAPAPPLDVSAACTWRPPAPPRSPAGGAIARAAAEVADAICRLVPPDGFGALLIGATPAFPLAGGAEEARALVAACAGGDAARAGATAERLLGLGSGLTPAGDDLVGGAFFARRMLVTGADDTGWGAATEAVRARAAERTHRISAALLGDLLDGEGYAPLHELAAALAAAAPAAALDAARRLIRIGHSSGWDLLAGLLGTLGAPVAPRLHPPADG